MDHINEEEQIILDVRSFDIWLNVFISFKSSHQWAVAHIKMKIENNLTNEAFRWILQKLAIVMWNKFWFEKNMNQSEKSNPSFCKSHQKGGSHYYDRRILTPSNDVRKYSVKSKTNIDNFHGKSPSSKSIEQK